jgi:hypothetical protein
MPRRRRGGPIGLPPGAVAWTGLWGNPPASASASAAGESDSDPESPAAKRARSCEYDSDSENEDLARRLVAQHHAEAEARRWTDGPRLLEDWTVEEVVAWRAELRRRQAAESEDEDRPALPHGDPPTDGDFTVYEREMGCRIEPFHMEEERRSGHLDTIGDWVRDRPDVRRPEDAWLRCVDEGTVPTAVIVSSPVAPSETAPPVPGVQEDYAALLGMLQEGERVSGALWRLRGAVPLRDTFQHLVEVVGRLVEAGAYALCDADPAEVRRLADGARERERRTAAAAGLPWEFAWGAPDGARQGPFPAHTMHAWKQAAFFSADRLAYARPAAVDMFAAEEPPWAEAHLVDYLA